MRICIWRRLLLSLFCRITCILLLMVLSNKKASSCIVPGRTVRFADFAKKSSIVLQAQAISTTAIQRSNGRYNATFKVFRRFPLKYGRFKVGNKIKIGPFGTDASCAQVKRRIKYILFLRRTSDPSDRQKVVYKMQFNPVPYSPKVAVFFRKVLTGAITGKRILRSGCPKQKRPKNGKIQCNLKRTRCRAACRQGFEPLGSKYRFCKIRSMNWNNKAPFQCINKSSKIQFGLAVRMSQKKKTNVNKSKRVWSLNKKGPKTQPRKDYEEEEEEKQVEKRRFRKPPPRQRALQKVTLPTITPQTIPSDTATSISKTKDRFALKNDSFNISSSAPDNIFSTNIRLPEQNPYSVTEDSVKSNNTDSPLQHPEVPNIFVSSPTPVIPENHNLNVTYNALQGGSSWVNGDGTTSRPIKGFGDAVVGCPTYKGNLSINSVWRGGFDAIVRFPNILEPLMGGWMVRLYINIEVERLETYTVDIFVISKSYREYCFVPKYYNVDLYEDLTLSFVGIVPNLSGSAKGIAGIGELLGVCETFKIRDKNVGQLVPYDDITGNVTEAWIGNKTEFPFVISDQAFAAPIDNKVFFSIASPVESLPYPSTTTPESTTKQIVAADRCSPSEPNGLLPEGGATVPDWLMSNKTGMDYNEILHKSILFYEAQRSGRLPDNNRVPWRGDADMKDGCLIDRDLSGGWYNAGGNVKTTLLIAFSTTMLAWGAIDYKDAYQEAGEYEHVMDQIRWAADYLIKCHISLNELVVQVGDFVPPRKGWNSPEDSYESTRTVYRADPRNPAADVAADTAAALASVSVVFNQTDPEYSALCLRHAREIYQFALNNPSAYSSSIRDQEWPLLTRNGVTDDLAWAEIWLHLATRNESYLSQAEERYFDLNHDQNIFSWGDKTRGLDVLLGRFSSIPTIYEIATSSYVKWLETATTTPQSLLWFDKTGTTMLAANAAFLTLQSIPFAKRRSQAIKYYRFAKRQLKAIIGFPLGTGFVVGIGNNSPTRPRHRGSTCPVPPAECTRKVLFNKQSNPNKLYGALVNGPGKRGSYLDMANNYVQNKVGITYNAGFQSLAAGLKYTESLSWLKKASLLS